MTQPLCRYCGKPTAKRTCSVYLKLPGQVHMTDHTFMRYLQVDKFPGNMDEVRRLTERAVVSVTRSASRAHIISFTEWDGESYVDLFFCKAQCAQQMGQLMAREGRCTRAYNEALRAQREQEKTS